MAFPGFVEAADVAESVNEGVIGSSSDASEVSFELGESLLDGIEVWGIGRQEEEPAPAVFESLCGPRAFVGGEVVKDDHGSGFEARCELGLDIGVEGGPVHGALDDPGGNQPVLGQAGDEGLGLPLAEGRGTVEPLAPGRAAAQAGQVGLHGGLVDEDQAVRHAPHAGLASGDPNPPGLADVRSLTLRGDQAFFYMTSRPA